MPIMPGEEWTAEESEAFLIGMVDMELERMKPALDNLGVPVPLVDKMFTRCRADRNTLYAGDFVLRWMKGERAFPELESE